MESLSIETRVEDGVARLDVVGEVDVSCASELRDALDKALATDDIEAIDVVLAEVPYIDSTGIGVLVGAASRASDAKIALRVLNPQRNVARVLALLGVDKELAVTKQDDGDNED